MAWRKLYSEFSTKDLSIGSDQRRTEFGSGKFHELSPKKSLSFSLGNCNTEKAIYEKVLGLRMECRKGLRKILLS